jgi:DNA/RNA-binding domain of Phe-tRNA-synthetase-like protein
MTLQKADDPRLDATLVCLVLAEGCAVGPTPPALVAELEALAARRAAEDFPPAAIKDAVRGMLRAGGYKPAGRQKPASEYLAQAAREGRFPVINGPVDCNNLLSLETGLPISLLDLRAFRDASVGGAADSIGAAAVCATVRICGAGEAYVFNASGHEMDLEGLLCVCDAAGTPLGNPVKDSMAGKLREDSVDLAGFIYAPALLYSRDALMAVGERFAELLTAHAGARSAVALEIA